MSQNLLVSALTVAIELTLQDKNALPVFVKTTKLGEEIGELCEAVLQQHGYVRADKSGVGTVLEESADVMLQVIDTLAYAYPDENAEALLTMFSLMVCKKLKKWANTKMDLEPGVYNRIICEQGITAQAVLAV